MPSLANNWTYPDHNGDPVIWPDASSYFNTLPDAVIPMILAETPAGLKFVQQFVDAILERAYVVGAETGSIDIVRGSGDTESPSEYALTLERGDDGTRYTFVNSLQEQVEQMFPSFIDRSQFTPSFGLLPSSYTFPRLQTNPPGSPTGTPMEWRAYRGTNVIGPGVFGPETYPGSQGARRASAGDFFGPWIFEQLRERIEQMDWVPIVEVPGFDVYVTPIVALQGSINHPQFTASPDITFTSTAPEQWLLNPGNSVGSPYTANLATMPPSAAGATREFYSTVGSLQLISDVGFQPGATDPKVTITHTGSVSLAATDVYEFAGYCVTRDEQNPSAPVCSGAVSSYSWSAPHYSSGEFLMPEGFQGVSSWAHWIFAKPTWKYGRMV